MKTFRRRLGSRITDNVAPTCGCVACREAGVTHLARVRVPPDDFCSQPRWLHGDELRAWHEARERALAAARERFGAKS